MLTMIHSNSARIENGILRVDRKFLTGMRLYAEQIDMPLMTIHPEMDATDQTMDLVQVPCKDLGFDVMIIKKDADPRETRERLQKQIRRSHLVYGSGFGSSQLARKLGVPYILVLEYDLGTHITVSVMQVQNVARRAIRSLRRLAHFIGHDIAEIRGALALHCNGYPVYAESRFFNANRLLYLDSRMSADMVITEQQLGDRLRQRSDRPLRLLFSGRYESLKGADDSVRVALECLKRGLDIELHTYGHGSLRDKMLQLASQSDGRIHIHDALPYPELVQRAYESDLFICCHIQSDPSCTYLESFGAGLPIVGYANRMWGRLSAFSQSGYASAMGRPSAVADDVARLIADADLLADMSRQARAFALNHVFEHEFTLRTVAINQTLAESGAARPITLHV
jgi:colanic acid/amylovoran biosynthesis glycosyltransferase